MPKKVLCVTMSVGECAEGTLEPDHLFKNPEVGRFIQTCSMSKKPFAILRADGLQMFNEAKKAPTKDVEDLGYDERVELGEQVGELIKAAKFDSIIFFSISGYEEAAYIHILQMTHIPYKVVKRLSRIGGEQIGQLSRGTTRTKVISLEPPDVVMLYRARGVLEMKAGKQIKETEVIRLLLEQFLKQNNITV